MLSIIQAAGWPIWPLILCSILALAFAIERFVQLQSRRVLGAQLVDEAIGVSRESVPPPDMVRQRWAFALSEMFVISVNSVTGVQPWCGLGGVHFWDTLARHGFGNFRDLLEEYTTK